MKRSAAPGPGVPAVLLAGLALGPGDVRAGEKDEDEKKVEKRVVVRHAGGGRLGVALDDTEGDLRGAKVRSVEEGSPAEKAGIKEGDVIVRFDGEAVRSASHLARLVGETPAGRSVAIEVDPRRRHAEAHRDPRRGEPAASGSSAARACPGMREFDFEMPDWEVEVPEPPAPPDAPSAARPVRAPMPPHAPARRTSGAGRATTAATWSSACSAAVRAGWASSTWRSASSSPSYFKLAGKTGVLVSSVDADGPAGKARDEGRRRDPQARHRDDRGRRRPARGGGGGRGRQGGHGDRPARRPAARPEGDAREAGDEGRGAAPPAIGM